MSDDPMSDDIVERLRLGQRTEYRWEEYRDAADEIERLRAENAELRALVEYIPSYEEDECHLDHHGLCHAHPGGFRDGGCWVVAARSWLAAHPVEA